MSKSVNAMPEIIKMRKEWEKTYGDTRMFDHYYMGLRDRVGKSWLRAMKGAQAFGAKLAHRPDKTKRVQIGLRAIGVYVNEWGEIERNINEAEKDTWLYVEEAK